MANGIPLSSKIMREEGYSDEDFIDESLENGFPDEVFEDDDYSEYSSIGESYARESSNQKSLEGASIDSPIIADITIYGERYNHDTGNYENTMTSVKVAFEDVKTHTYEGDYGFDEYKDHAEGIVLSDSKIDDTGHQYKAGSHLSVPLEDLSINETHEPSPEELKLRDELVAQREYIVTGRVYSDIEMQEGKDGYDISRRADPIFEQNHIYKGFRTMDEVEAQLLKDHPEQYISHSIKSTKYNEFSMSAIPSAYDSNGESLDKYKAGDPVPDWATVEGREKIVKDIAERRGLECGEFKYDYLPDDVYLHPQNNYEKIMNAMAASEFNQVSTATCTTNTGETVDILVGYDNLQANYGGNNLYDIQTSDMISYSTQMDEARRIDESTYPTDKSGLAEAISNDLDSWETVKECDFRMKEELLQDYFDSIYPKCISGELSKSHDIDCRLETFMDAHRDLYGNKSGSICADHGAPGVGPDFSNCTVMKSQTNEGAVFSGGLRDEYGNYQSEANLIEYCKIMNYDHAVKVENYTKDSSRDSAVYTCWRGDAESIKDEKLKTEVQLAESRGSKNIMEGVKPYEIHSEYLPNGMSRDKSVTPVQQTQAAESDKSDESFTIDNIRANQVSKEFQFPDGTPYRVAKVYVDKSVSDSNYAYVSVSPDKLKRKDDGTYSIDYDKDTTRKVGIDHKIGEENGRPKYAKTYENVSHRSIAESHSKAVEAANQHLKKSIVEQTIEKGDNVTEATDRQNLIEQQK